MQSMIGKPITYHNQALCAAGTEYAIGDTIPYLTYKDNSGIENAIKNLILLEVKNGSILVQHYTGEKLKINTNDITQITCNN